MTQSKSFQLNRISPVSGNKKILTIVMDGVGYTNPNANITSEIKNQKGILPSEAFITGNAVNAAYTPNLDNLISSSLFRTLKAHGTAVGLPSDDDMGNSEVGHNALGAGRVFAQGAKLVNSAIQSGKIFEGTAWKQVVGREELKNKKNTLHLCGLLSDGNVHSHIDHLFALIKGAKTEGVQKVRLHLLLDGRDVGPLTATEYILKLDSFLKEINSDHFDCKVASGGGRTFVTMDRYESDWSIVERGYQAHILGEGRGFSSLLNAVETLRQEKNYYDQDLPPFVILDNNKPLGTVEENDSFIFFNFRGDRAIEISRALTEQNFKSFPRKRFPKIYYAGMMQYDGDLKLPELFLVTPPAIDRTLTELLCNASVKQFACSETQKYGHVTYFWNGNRSGKFNAELENYIEIPSDLIPFQERPWMKSAEIADITIKNMYDNSFEIGRINFANGDMVGHSGDFAAAVLSVAAVDLALGRIMKAAKETNTILIVVADHGNADEMYELDKKTKKVIFDDNGKPKLKTSHTLAPVPCAIYNTEILEKNVSLKTDMPNAGLANIASTILDIAGFNTPDFYEPSLIEFHSEKKILKQS
jgi:2,3-bisphosphoglycerate-independent phosphoglycerate mutase